MNQFPLMRIQGRNALRVQAVLNRGLSFVHHKNKEPKRQCNIYINPKEEIVKPKQPPQPLTEKEIEDKKKMSEYGKEYRRREKIRDLICDSIEEATGNGIAKRRLIQRVWLLWRSDRTLFDNEDKVVHELNTRGFLSI